MSPNAAHMHGSLAGTHLAISTLSDWDNLFVAGFHALLLKTLKPAMKRSLEPTLACVWKHVCVQIDQHMRVFACDRDRACTRTAHACTLALTSTRTVCVCIQCSHTASLTCVAEGVLLSACRAGVRCCSPSHVVVAQGSLCGCQGHHACLPAVQQGQGEGLGSLFLLLALSLPSFLAPSRLGSPLLAPHDPHDPRSSPLVA